LHEGSCGLEFDPGAAWNVTRFAHAHATHSLKVVQKLHLQVQKTHRTRAEGAPPILEVAHSRAQISSELAIFSGDRSA
jgi:hypothetical protein